MDKFRLIDEIRTKNGYLQNKLRQYKAHCNRMFTNLKTKNPELATIYKLESNQAKFLLFDSKKFLLKNLRILKGKSDEFSSVYTKYTQCFVNSKNKTLTIEELVALRETLSLYYTFVEDIVKLNSFNHDFDKYKINHKWHDINLIFDSENALNSFLNKTSNKNDYRFYNQLALKILNIEENKELLCKYLEQKKTHILQFYRLADKFLNLLQSFSVFINDNFIASEYIDDLLNSAQKIRAFATELKNYREPEVLKPEVSAFIAPKYFENYSDGFESLRSSAFIYRRALLKLLVTEFEKELICDTKKRTLPFLPEFYDLAYDFIEYPKKNEGVSGLLQSLRFSNKK